MDATKSRQGTEVTMDATKSRQGTEVTIALQPMYEHEVPSTQ